MPGRALKELQQSKPFPSLQDEAFINIQITADVQLQRINALLKPHKLSPAQYNVLRILRGAGRDGLPCGEISGRMIQHDPDVTRLLDRLEKRGLVARSREQHDRRVVTVRATEAGLELLAKVDGPLTECVSGFFRNLSEEKLTTLITYLEEAR